MLSKKYLIALYTSDSQFWFSGSTVGSQSFLPSKFCVFPFFNFMSKWVRNRVQTPHFEWRTRTHLPFGVLTTMIESVIIWHWWCKIRGYCETVILILMVIEMWGSRYHRNTLSHYREMHRKMIFEFPRSLFAEGYFVM